MWMGVQRGADYRDIYPSDLTDRLVAEGVLSDNEVALVGVANNELGVSGMTTFQVLKGILENEIDNSLGYIDSETVEDRKRALEYYLRQPYGNEVEGRSQIVTGEVAEAIDGALPQLIRVFTTTEDIVYFEPKSPGDDVSPINFIPVPLFLVTYEEGANGQVDNVYRKIRMKAESIQRQWPDAKIEGQLARLIQDKPTEDVELLEATVYDAKRGDYCYHVIYTHGKDELVYRRRKSSPWVISRYMKVAGEIYGRGPLLTALPDIKTLNKTIELLLKNASLAVSGVYTAADDGVLNPNTVKLAPGAIIPVARNGGPQGPALAALPRAGDFNVSQLVINDLRANVKRIFLGTA